MVFFIIDAVYILNAFTLLTTYVIMCFCCNKKEEKKCPVRPVTNSMRAGLPPEGILADSMMTAMGAQPKEDPKVITEEEKGSRRIKKKKDKSEKSKREIKNKKKGNGKGNKDGSEGEQPGQNSNNQSEGEKKTEEKEKDTVGSTQESTHTQNTAKTSNLPTTIKTALPKSVVSVDMGGQSPMQPSKPNSSPQVSPAENKTPDGQPPKSAGIASGTGIYPKGIRSTAAF